MVTDGKSQHCYYGSIWLMTSSRLVLPVSWCLTIILSFLLFLSGKSTLLKLICCENAPSEGTVSTRSGASCVYIFIEMICFYLPPPTCGAPTSTTSSPDQCHFLPLPLPLPQACPWADSTNTQLRCWTWRWVQWTTSRVSIRTSTRLTDWRSGVLWWATTASPRITICYPSSCSQMVWRHD